MKAFYLDPLGGDLLVDEREGVVACVHRPEDTPHAVEEAFATARPEPEQQQIKRMRMNT